MVRDWTPGTFPLSERVPRTSPQKNIKYDELVKSKRHTSISNQRLNPRPGQYLTHASTNPYQPGGVVTSNTPVPCAEVCYRAPH